MKRFFSIFFILPLFGMEPDAPSTIRFWLINKRSSTVTVTLTNPGSQESYKVCVPPCDNVCIEDFNIGKYFATQADGSWVTEAAAEEKTTDETSRTLAQKALYTTPALGAAKSLQLLINKPPFHK